MRIETGRVGILLAVVLLASCSGDRGASASARSPLVVAVSDGLPMTLQEVDDSFGRDLFQMRARALKILLLRRLLEAEARQRGKSPEEIYREAVKEAVVPPSAAELKKYYEDAKSRGEVEPDADYNAYVQQATGALNRTREMDLENVLFDTLAERAKLRIDLNVLGFDPLKSTASGPSRGQTNAKIVITEYSDFQSPFCAMGNETVKKVLETYPTQVLFEFRAKPDAKHEYAQKAWEAGLCAADQGKYWEYRQHLFQHQSALTVDDLKQYAKALSLNATTFDACLESSKHASQVAKHAREVKEMGVDGNPVFIVNGFPYSGAHPFSTFQRAIDSMLSNRFLP